MSPLLVIIPAAALFLLTRRKPPVENCGRLEVTPAMAYTNMAKSIGVMATITPSTPAIVALRKMMQVHFPSCQLKANTIATIVPQSGYNEVEWRDIVKVFGNKTLAQAEKDPEVMALFGAQLAGAPTSLDLEGASGGVEPGARLLHIFA